MKKNLITAILLAVGCIQAMAQETFPRNDVQDSRINAYALVGATIYVDHSTKIDNGTLLIKDGKVEQILKGTSVPTGYVKIDSKGKFIYPSFIEMHSNYGLSKKVSSGGRSFSGPEQIMPKTAGAYNANDAIKAHINASTTFVVNKKDASSLRSIGFGTVLSHHHDGIARGTSTLATLGDKNENKNMLTAQAAAHYSFKKGSSKQSYPISAMGSVALLRQTFMDADWYRNNQSFSEITLEAWNQNRGLPQIFDAGDKFAVSRADMVGDEFGVQFIIKSDGSAYQRIDDIKQTGATLIVPISFPAPFDVSNVYENLDISLIDLKHWELAPTNLKAIEQNNIPFTISSTGLASKKLFLQNLRTAVKHGLSKSGALKALTTTPAQVLKADDKIGSLKNGRLANFIVTSEDIFSEKSKILENWVQGKKYNVSKSPASIENGQYDLTVGAKNHKVNIKDRSFKIEINDSTLLKMKAKVEESLISLDFVVDKNASPVNLSGWRTDKGWRGQGQIENGKWIDWTLNKVADLDNDQKEESKDETAEDSESKLGEVIYPFQAFGQVSIPKTQTILIKNATVWTNESEGIMENTDVLLKDGKISKVGKGLKASGALEVDGTGKHLTPGIIDEHSHIGLFNVNDVAVNSGMVRMNDVVDPEDVNIYRQLSGGVTSAQLLHGSANPVGGQSALIKLRWGKSAKEMLIEGADGFIKFALGENVKRSRNPASIRFPQTRMGVEQVYIDAFTNALEYQKKWTKYNGLASKDKANATVPRRDLVHETMLEIINKKRFVSCHSYVQSEINMLMKVADQFNFKINTFTHILEGYKVADKMKAHGAGASTFADWWAYKWEVRYAIPYNPALMHGAGVTVAINSDDAEMGRRLNQEAAKSVKYGNMPEEDALKMVTLNPAKLLHLDNRTGSIKIGKDADVVLWNDHPLSIYAKAEKTIVDGIIYFDREKDAELRESMNEERNRIIQKMKTMKTPGMTPKAPMGRPHKDFHCDTMVGMD